jgi:hypothetical protein
VELLKELSMDRAIIVDRYGNPIEADADIIPDGATLRVPMRFRRRWREPGGAGGFGIHR